jgi:transcriptional regulator with XRE-family HTH domain
MTHRDSYFLDKMDTSKNKVTIMEMKINLDRLKSERNKRAWTQNHLAEVCGLSLRTIQRIEKTGSASNESIQALASVFSISIEDLLNGFETNADEINFESTPAINSRGKTFALIGLILLLVVPVIATMISLTGSSIIVEVSKGSTIRFVDSNYLTLMVHTSTGILTLIPSLFLLLISFFKYQYKKTWVKFVIFLTTVSLAIASNTLGVLALFSILGFYIFFNRQKNLELKH